MTVSPPRSLNQSHPSDSSLWAMPTGFLWGVSTSAHQVEGDNGNSQWSLWEAAGRIKSGEHCGQACDWWRNAERDFELARGLGLNAMRRSEEHTSELQSHV